MLNKFLIMMGWKTYRGRWDFSEVMIDLAIYTIIGGLIWLLITIL